MKSKRHIYYLIVDILIITFSFLFTAALKPATVRFYLPNYFYPFLVFATIWILISIFDKKYQKVENRRLRIQIAGIIKTNFIILAFIMILLYAFHQYHYSRLIVLGTILLSTIIEIFIVSIYNALIINTQTYYDPETDKFLQKENGTGVEKSPVVLHDSSKNKTIDVKTLSNLKKLIIEESGEYVYNFISSISGFHKENCLAISTATLLNILLLPNDTYATIINLRKINDIRRINKFFEAVNSKLSYDSLFFCCVETYGLRKKRILKKLPFIINYIYYFFDYIFTRILPKLPITKQIYFAITRGNKRVLSQAETYGRLYSCGFSVIAEKYINDCLYVVSVKIKEPAYDYNPTYGLFIKLRRYGKNGKIIKIYKIRTMHPYAEYLQEFIYQRNNLQEGGKFKDDFRRSSLGKLLRRFWIDEIPSIINLIKGDLKLVGVRPLSPQYFSLYHEVLKQKRQNFKPGLIPPFYANMPKTLDEIMVSELKYLEEYEKHPLRTDIKYFFKVMYNIIFKKVRSN